MMLDRIVEVFCEVDDFCKAFVPQWEASLLGTGGPPPRGPHAAQRDHHAAAHSSGFKHLKSFYPGFAEPLASITASPSRWLLSRPAVLRALRRPAEKRLRAAGGLPPQPP